MTHIATIRHTLHLSSSVVALLLGTGLVHAYNAPPCAGAWNTAFNASGLEGHTIHALAVHDSELIIGGTFTAHTGWSPNHVARWDTASESWQPLGSGTNGPVHALLAYNGDLYAGGFFTQAGGQIVNHIGRWDGEQWHPIGDGFNNAVKTLAVYDGDVIAGGLFTHAGQTEVSRIARLDGGAWQPVAGGMNGMVLSLGTFDGQLIAGGRFSQAGAAEAINIARLNGKDWHALGGPVSDSGEPGIGTAKPVWVITEHDGILFIAGSFIVLRSPNVHPLIQNQAIGSLFSLYSAIWEGPGLGWTTSSLFGREPNRMIRAMREFDGNLIAAGDFTRITGEYPDGSDTFAARLAKWESDGWQSVGHGVGGPPNAASYDLIEYQDELVVAGYFTDVADGLAATSIAAWDGTISAGPADLTCDGVVGVQDLLLVIAAFGPCPPPEDSTCAADLNSDGIVNVQDLLILLASWG